MLSHRLRIEPGCLNNGGVVGGGRVRVGEEGNLRQVMGVKDATRGNHGGYGKNKQGLKMYNWKKTREWKYLQLGTAEYQHG